MLERKTQFASLLLWKGIKILKKIEIFGLLSVNS